MVSPGYAVSQCVFSLEVQKGAFELVAREFRLVSIRCTRLPELDPLRQSLAEQTSEALPQTSDVVKGINVALENFGTNFPDAAKIILIFTDVKFASGNVPLPVTNPTALNVKVFVYKLPPINDGKLFLESSDPFADQQCSIGSSFEVISKLSGLSNPLMALNSLLTFTAALHVEVANSSADNSPICAGYEEIEGNITTVSTPVFGANKTLYGVVGTDIFINNLDSLMDSVQAAILTRSAGKGFKSSNFPLTRADCFLQTAMPSAESWTSVTVNGGFCSRTDQKSKIGDLACCGSCKKGGKGDTLGPGAIAGIAISAAAVLALFYWALVCYFRCCNVNNQRPPQPGAEANSFGE